MSPHEICKESFILPELSLEELPQLLESSLGGVATDFSLVTARGVPQPRVLYHSIRLFRWILMRHLWTLADNWLFRYPSVSFTGDYSHAPTTSRIPFSLSLPPNSNDTLVDSSWQLAVELPQLLVSSPGRVATEFSLVTDIGVPQPRALYHSIRLVHWVLITPLRTQSDCWLWSYLHFWWSSWV